MTTHDQMKKLQWVSPPASQPAPPTPTSPISVKGSFLVNDLLQLFHVLRKKVVPEGIGPWTVVRLSPSEFVELEQKVKLDGELKVWFDFKARLDLDHRSGCLVIRMPDSIHEWVICRLEREIFRFLSTIDDDPAMPSNVRDLARQVQVLRSADIYLTGGSKRSPDSSFQHPLAKKPTLVLEVANSENGKNLKKLAYDYLINSDGVIHVVVGIDLKYRTSAATISVWRSRWGNRPDGDLALQIVKDPSDHAFRAGDGSIVHGTLNLRLSDFLPREIISTLNHLNPSIAISYQFLYDTLQQGEEFIRRTTPKEWEPLSHFVVEGLSSDSSGDELTASDELAVRHFEESAERRAELQDPDYT